jgi:hypothetical protein
MSYDAWGDPPEPPYDAETEGYEAFHDGLKPEDNPHDEGTDEFWGWAEGFERAAGEE